VELAALGFWIATALGGMLLFGVTLRQSNDENVADRTDLPEPVVFTHAALALGGLAAWTLYMFTGGDDGPTGWTAFAALAVVALLGAYMFMRWQRGRRLTDERARERLIEQQFPTSVVHTHGLLAAVTIVLVVLALI